MKINKKNIIIAIVAFLLLVGIIQKVVRFITTSINAREAKYVALVEKPTLTNGEDGLELSGELKPYLQTEMFSRINGLVSERCVQLGDHVKKRTIACNY